MAPLRRKGNRRPGGAAVMAGKKKLPVQGRGAQRDQSSSRSGSSRSGSSESRSRSSDEDSSSDASDSDEDHPDDYKKGGYHPVMPYQLYNGRFRVLSKLGAGAFSTVWLCTDEKETSQLVAMKVCKSKKSVTEQAEDEVALFNTIQEGNICSPHTVEMCGHFWHSGPNGRHKCMVFEVMGENLLALVKYYNYHGLPLNIVRRLARHTLIGLEYIHSRGVIHTDVKLENVLVQRHDLNELLREAHRAHRIFTEQKGGDEGLTKSQKKRLKNKKKQTEVTEGKATEVAKPADGEVLSKSQKKKKNKQKNKQKDEDAKGEAGGDSEAEEPTGAVAAAANGNDNKGNDDGEGDDSDDDPDRAAAEACGRPVPPVRQKERFKTLSASQVFAKLADFGNGCRVDKKVTDDIQTRQYRSPEVIIGADWDETADIWSAACMFFELITGDFLFDPRTGENWNRNEDHLALVSELIGDCPSKEYLLSGKYSREFFTNAGKLKHIKSLKYWSLEKVLMEKYKWTDDEAEELSTFLLPMLEWQPKNRCSATQALQHFWVKAAPGEVDIPDPDKLNSSHGSAETDTPPIEDCNVQPAKHPEDSLLGMLHMGQAADNADVEVPAVKAAAEDRGTTEAVSPSSPTEVLEVAAPEAAASKPSEASVPKAAASEAGYPSAAEVPLAPEAAPSQPLEPTEADTPQDDSRRPALEATAPVVAEVAEPASAVQAADDAACEGTSVEAFVDLNSLDLSDSLQLVAALEQSDCDRLSLEAGCECKRLDSRHVLVLIRASAASAVVTAAELARKVQGVSRWMSVEEYRAANPPDGDEEGADDKPKKKKNNNKKKGKK